MSMTSSGVGLPIAELSKAPNPTRSSYNRLRSGTEHLRRNAVRPLRGGASSHYGRAASARKEGSRRPAVMHDARGVPYDRQFRRFVRVWSDAMRCNWGGVYPAAV